MKLRASIIIFLSLSLTICCGLTLKPSVEFWPFLRYSMYSGHFTPGDSFYHLQLRVVSASDPKNEIIVRDSDSFGFIQTLGALLELSRVMKLDQATGSFDGSRLEVIKPRMRALLRSYQAMNSAKISASKMRLYLVAHSRDDVNPMKDRGELKLICEVL